MIREIEPVNVDDIKGDTKYRLVFLDKDLIDAGIPKKSIRDDFDKYQGFVVTTEDLCDCSFCRGNLRVSNMVAIKELCPWYVPIDVLYPLDSKL